MQVQIPFPLRELGTLLGREESMHSVHAAVLRAAHSLRPVVESGTMLAACSDEFNGELRAAFHRDVAGQLSAPDIPSTRRVFSLSNLGGRVEPGAISLANLHFTARSARDGEKLLLIEVTGHVGRRETAGGARWGELDRFGTASPCCGALRLLLDDPASASAVRFPWFDQLTAFFGAARLATLRNDTSAHAMLRAAIVHAVLQSETALVDLLRDSPSSPTHVLLVALVVVNRRGADNAIPVALHHLHFASGEPEFRMGAALRSTPEALVVDASRAQVQVRSPFEELAPPAQVPSPRASALTGVRERGPGVTRLVERARRQVRGIARLPDGASVYSRAVLRAFVQELGVEAPEVALAALALEERRVLVQLRPGELRLEELALRGPSRTEARRTLHDLEPSLQQLRQEEARVLLEILLAPEHPLLGVPR